jgi:hypothetical protein
MSTQHKRKADVKKHVLVMDGRFPHFSDLRDNPSSTPKSFTELEQSLSTISRASGDTRLESRMVFGEIELGTAQCGIGCSGPAAVEDEPNIFEVQILRSKGMLLGSVGRKECAYMFVPLWRCCISGASFERVLEPKPAPSVCDVEVVVLFIRRLGRDGVFFGRLGKAVEFDAPFAVAPFARASPLDL